MAAGVAISPADPDDTEAASPPAWRQLPHAPLVPDIVLKAHHCLVATDNRFAAAARMLAALWREERAIPIGILSDGPRPPTGRIKLGSRISGRAARDGETFLDRTIVAFAIAELLFREPGSVWDEERLWTNLLSSQTLAVNLFGPMAMDLELATAIWSMLLPGFVARVTRLRFEHSPGRFQANYFGDGTALDVLVELVTPDGEPAIIAIEVKFVENMLARVARHRERYDQTAEQSGLFHDASAPLLRKPGFEQLRREHVMTQLMIDHGLASRAHFIVVAPQLNRRASVSNRIYAGELVDATGVTPHNDGRQRVGFRGIALEAVIGAMAESGAQRYASALWSRYCAFDRVVRRTMDVLLSDARRKRQSVAPAETNDVEQVGI